jgi:hypothetical protein
MRGCGEHKTPFYYYVLYNAEERQVKNVLRRAICVEWAHRSAADALVGLLVWMSLILQANERVRGDPRGPGVRPTLLRPPLPTCEADPQAQAHYSPQAS